MGRSRRTWPVLPVSGVRERPAPAPALRLLEAVRGRGGRQGRRDVEGAQHRGRPGRVPHAGPGSVPDQGAIKKVIEREHLGHHEEPDLLFLNYKIIDEIGHEYFADSPEMADTIRVAGPVPGVARGRTSNKNLPNQCVLCLTADHGHTATPGRTGGTPVSETRVHSLLQSRFDTDGDGRSLVQIARPTGHVPQSRRDPAERHVRLAAMSTYLSEANAVAGGRSPTRSARVRAHAGVRRCVRRVDRAAPRLRLGRAPCRAAAPGSGSTRARRSNRTSRPDPGVHGTWSTATNSAVSVWWPGVTGIDGVPAVPGHEDQGAVEETGGRARCRGRASSTRRTMYPAAAGHDGTRRARPAPGCHGTPARRSAGRSRRWPSRSAPGGRGFGRMIGGRTTARISEATASPTSVHAHGRGEPGERAAPQPGDADPAQEHRGDHEPRGHALVERAPGAVGEHGGQRRRFFFGDRRRVEDPRGAPEPVPAGGRDRRACRRPPAAATPRRHGPGPVRATAAPRATPATTTATPITIHGRAEPDPPPTGVPAETVPVVATS